VICRDWKAVSAAAVVDSGKHLGLLAEMACVSLDQDFYAVVAEVNAGAVAAGTLQALTHVSVRSGMLGVGGDPVVEGRCCPKVFAWWPGGRCSIVVAAAVVVDLAHIHMVVVPYLHEEEYIVQEHQGWKKDEALQLEKMV